MESAEGLVVEITSDGKARVLIQAGDPCISCDTKVEACHCSGGSSRLVVKACNPAGAEEGDFVAVSHRPGAVMKSTILFLVIPALGLLSGFLAGRLSSLSERGTLAATLGGLFLAIIISVISYHRFSEQLRPYVSRVMRHS